MKKRKIVGKTQRKLDPLKIAKALRASRMGRVNIPYYYAPQNLGKLSNLVKKRLSSVVVSSEAIMVEAMLGGIKSVWLNEINRPSRNVGQRFQRLSFVELILRVLKRGMGNVDFIKALRNHYEKKR